MPKVNRQVLMDRFKSTIEKALAQRMRMLGLDVHKKTLSAETFRKLSESLKSSTNQQRPEYHKMRKHFELQLKERMSGKSPSKAKTRMEKPVPHKPLLTSGKTFKSVTKEESKNTETLSNLEVVTTPTRAPVPTPRLRASTSSSLMARDGEAPAVSNVKELSQHLERQV